MDPYGFDPNAVDDDLTSLAVIAKPGVPNADASPNKPSANQSDAAGTAGGKIPDDAPDGVNGSRVARPFGLDPAVTPVLGSYHEQVAAHATSVWYRLPEQSPDRAPIVVVTAAGAIWSHGEDGKLDYGMHDPVFSLAQQREGRLRILAVSTATRLQANPDMPTMTESGVPMDLTGWWAAMLPSATPRPVIDRVNEWFATIVGTDETRKFLNGFGGDPFINTPDAAQALFLKAIKDWGDYVRLARIVPQ